MKTDSKKQLHHAWTYIRLLKPIYLVVILILLVLASTLALRANYMNMVNLRESLYAADKNNGDVEKSLNELRQFVYGHMNTDLTSGQNSVYPPIQLKYTYERLVTAEQDRIRTTNSTIYSDAQSYCERLHPESFSGGPRVPCIKEYVSSRGVTTKTIPDGLYKFDFVSPFWSPDLAGWLVATTIFVALLLIVRIGLAYYLDKTQVI